MKRAKICSHESGKQANASLAEYSHTYETIQHLKIGFKLTPSAVEKFIFISQHNNMHRKELSPIFGHSHGCHDPQTGVMPTYIYLDIYKMYDTNVYIGRHESLTFMLLFRGDGTHGYVQKYGLWGCLRM